MTPMILHLHTGRSALMTDGTVLLKQAIGDADKPITRNIQSIPKNTLTKSITQK